MPPLLDHGGYRKAGYLTMAVFTTWLMDKAYFLFFALGAAFLLICISNLFAVPKLKSPKQRRDVRVSLLVPARNEENNIERCVRGLLSQEYGNYEVIVLNDNSTDSTGEILERLSKEDRRLKVINGKPLPEGWLGMCWACMQLAEASDGRYLMFFDADTWHEPIVLGATLDVFEKTDADCISGIAKHHLGTFGEMLSVTLAPWGMMSYFPAVLMHNFRFKFPSIAAGMYMCFKREKYFEVGGHGAVRFNAVLDKDLAKLMKGRGMKVVMVDATEAVHVRMYHSMKEAFAGFGKNMFAAFEFRVIPFVGVFAAMLLSVLLPFAYLAANKTADPALASRAAVLIGLSLALWLIVHIKTKLPIWLAFLYPLMFVSWFLMALNSVGHALFGKSSWKGRKMPKPVVKLI